jgi:hypothetical protein
MTGLPAWANTMNIMISYRRADSGPITGRIYDRLRAHFGADHVFIDIDSIPMGIDYRGHIQSYVGHCDVLLPVIGPRWTGPAEGGQRRIDDPGDLVRLEVAHALERDIRVIPLLVDDAHLPTTEELPEDLRSLRFRNSLRVDSGIDFHHHIDRLCAAIETAARKAEGTAAVAEKPVTIVPPSPPFPPPPPVMPPPPPIFEAGPDLAAPVAPPLPLHAPVQKKRWALVALALLALLVAALGVFHFVPSKSSRAPTPSPAPGQPSARKITRVPDSRHFPPSSVGALVVGIWNQGDTTMYFFEDNTFATEGSTRGGDEGRWELSGRHVIAKGIPAHATRTWMLNLSSDGKFLTGQMTEKWSDSERAEHVKLSRQ